MKNANRRRLFIVLIFSCFLLFCVGLAIFLSLAKKRSDSLQSSDLTQFNQDQGKDYSFQRFDPPGEIIKIVVNRYPRTGPNTFWTATFEKGETTFLTKFSHYQGQYSGEGDCVFDLGIFDNVSQEINQSFSTTIEKFEASEFEGDFYKAGYSSPIYSVTLFFQDNTNQRFSLELIPSAEKKGLQLRLGGEVYNNNQFAIVNRNTFSRNLTPLIKAGSECVVEIYKKSP